MNSWKDRDSKPSLSPKALLIGLVVGCLVFTLAVLLTGATANLADYSDPTVGEETAPPSVASTLDGEASTAQPQPSPTVAKATGPETRIHPKQNAETKAHAIDAAVKR